MTVIRNGILGLACVVVGACESGPDPSPPDNGPVPIPVDVVYRGSQCPATEPGASVIDDAAAWAEWRAARPQSFFPAADGPDADVDFGAARVIVVSMGTRPTAGYALDVPAGTARLHGDVLEIDADWREPAAGAVVAQMLTSPCIAIAVPRVSFGRVRVTSQDGDTVIDDAVVQTGL